MSGGKGNGVPHQLIDQMVKLEAKLTGRHNDLAKGHNNLLVTQNELVTKHNEMAANIQALEQLVKQVAGFTAAELGKFQGTSQQHVQTLGRSVQGLDVNVLALAEMTKEVVGQLTQIDTFFKRIHAASEKLFNGERTEESLIEFKNVLELSEAEVGVIKTDAEQWYKDLVTSSFSKVKEKIEAQDRATMELEAKQKAEAEAAAAQAEAEKSSLSEATVVENELKAASEAERAVVANKSGGPGSAFPDGSEIFGG